jgi:predicted NBD/HSP70 family sugar kinase
MHKISPTTVTIAVNELIQQGLASNMGTGESSGGRKPILVRFCPDNKFLIGVSVTNTHITIAEMNLDAAVVRKREFFNENFSGDNVIACILDAIDAFLLDCTHLDTCIGISIVMPGIIDANQGLIWHTPKLNLKNVYFKDLVQKRFGLKTWIENDSNSLVLAEKKFGKYNQFGNILYIAVDEGVGAGIFYNGTILRGFRGGGGEFGHTSIDKKGIPCVCGNVGCLENYISWPAVRQKIIASIAAGAQTTISALAPDGIDNMGPEVWNRALQMEDPLAMQLLESMVEDLSSGIVNLINLFNPDIILLGGSMLDGNDRLHDMIRKHVSGRALGILVDDLGIYPSSLGTDKLLIGAAANILEEFFQFSLAK